ncbi:MAG TPA: AAA family ATPase, partial [Nannocystaceae bacterium]|nr:AAA family ATPase [Nannocystaceae bacterium]
MILDRLEVEGFGCVVKADVELGPGLNVLYGPNDLGKSTLAQAVRAALLLQHKSREHERFKPWHADAVPTVRLAFVADDGKHWRVRKTFDYSSRGSSTLEWSPDGVHWSPDKKGREVDGELRKMLGWGVGEAGGRAAPRGFPPSFLATALLGEHADVHAVLDGDLHKDADGSGRSRLTEALQALAEDPRFKAVLLRASAKVEEAK